jgi:predicted MFS family arabinose efflux permease
MSWQYYHTVWLVMGFGWVSLYIVRMGIAPVLGMIMVEFQISYATAGSLFSVILFSYTLMQIPAGYLGDRFGRRKLFILGALAWFFLSLVTSLVQTFVMLVLVRFLTGIAHGIYFGNDRPTIVAFTPKEKMAQGQGISFMGLALGFFLGVILAGIIAEYTGNWRWVFAAFSIPSLVTSFLMFRHIQEPPRPDPNGRPTNASHSVRKALTDRDLWLLYLAGFAMLYGYWLMATWMPSIFQEIGIRSVGASSLFAGILGLVGIPGLYASGILSDLMLRKGYGRKWLIVIYVLVWSAVMVGTGYAVENLRSSPVLISILFFGSGFVVFGVWSPYYALLSELAPPESVGMTFGLANFIGFLSAWVAPYLTGYMKDATGSFSGGLYLAGGIMMVGALLLMAVRGPVRAKAA